MQVPVEPRGAVEGCRPHLAIQPDLAAAGDECRAEGRTPHRFGGE
ncbi:hypothetical protein [Micromonospora sp. NPDC005806]